MFFHFFQKNKIINEAPIFYLQNLLNIEDKINIYHHHLQATSFLLTTNLINYSVDNIHLKHFHYY